MLRCKELTNSKDSKRKVSFAVGKPYKHALQEIFLAGIQAAGGTALAVYTYKSSASPIWPIASSVVAFGGTCNIFRSILKIFRGSVCSGRDESSECNVINGTMDYFASLYGFSTAWKCNSQLWIPCLGSAASGFYFAVSSINYLKIFSILEPHLKSCQLAFEPALILGGTIYLLYFLNHEEKYFYWVSLILTGATVLKSTILGVNMYIGKLQPLKRDGLRVSCLLGIGVISYFTAVHGFSVALKCNKYVWIIPCLAVGSISYTLSVTVMAIVRRTVLSRSPFMKCCQLLFGPALMASAGYYLLIFRQHEEKWLLCLPMVASAIVGNHITAVGYQRVKSNSEPRWLLFKGLELLIGGCLLLTNGSMLLIYGASNQFHPVFVAIFVIMIFNGVMGIIKSLGSFQRCVEMDATVFHSICGMIVGPIVFLSGCISIRCISHPKMMPASIVLLGTGHSLFVISIIKLHDLVPKPVFNRYCQRVLGPVVTLYSSLASLYVGYSKGWLFSQPIVTLLPAGIYTTYKGFRRGN